MIYDVYDLLTSAGFLGKYQNGSLFLKVAIPVFQILCIY